MAPAKARTRSWLLSMVLRRYVEQRDAFLKECQSPWLVWEHGPWKPPSSDDVTARVPTLREMEALSEGTDLLCFHLMPTPGAACTFRIGRDRGNEVAINDATVSRRHLELSCDATGRWSAVELSAPDKPQALTSKSALTLGGVKLTFLMPDDWVKRIEAEAKSPRGR